MIYLISKRKENFLDHDAQIIIRELIQHLLDYADKQQWKKVDTIMQLSKDNPDLKIKDHTLILQDTKHTSTGKMILDRITNALKKKEWDKVSKLLDLGIIEANYDKGAIAKKILLNNDDSTKDAPIDLLKDLVEKYALDVHIDNNFLFKQEKQNIDTMIYLISKRKHGFLGRESKIIRGYLIHHLLDYIEKKSITRRPRYINIIEGRT